MEKDIEEIKNHFVDDSMTVKNGAQGITVKIFHNNKFFSFYQHFFILYLTYTLRTRLQ